MGGGAFRATKGGEEGSGECPGCSRGSEGGKGNEQEASEEQGQRWDRRAAAPAGGAAASCQRGGTSQAYVAPSDKPCLASCTRLHSVDLNRGSQLRLGRRVGALRLGLHLRVACAAIRLLRAAQRLPQGRNGVSWEVTVVHGARCRTKGHPSITGEHGRWPGAARSPVNLAATARQQGEQGSGHPPGGQAWRTLPTWSLPFSTSHTGRGGPPARGLWQRTEMRWLK